MKRVCLDQEDLSDEAICSVPKRAPQRGPRHPFIIIVHLLEKGSKTSECADGRFFNIVKSSHKEHST